ncbi:hypothetical protein AALP_AA4G116900 [Arabis alpina]|uniref:Endonuclease/exonuclease/phosphatase domain-containing protein n=1 Tax=Arabis alpina TaxID=50452 RepID=A0A087H2N3_ARAAL|nr:hypothetical protein AALP_AA4G116900 [Arabis alpina]
MLQPEKPKKKKVKPLKPKGQQRAKGIVINEPSLNEESPITTRPKFKAADEKGKGKVSSTFKDPPKSLAGTSSMDIVVDQAALEVTSEPEPSSTGSSSECSSSENDSYQSGEDDNPEEDDQFIEVLTRSQTKLPGSAQEMVVSFVYALNTKAGRAPLWEELMVSAMDVRVRRLPWVVVGDLNQALDPMDSSKPTSRITKGMNELKTCLDSSRLSDLTFRGNHYTW